MAKKVRKLLQKKHDDVRGLEFDGTNAAEVIAFAEAETGPASKAALNTGFLLENGKLTYYYAPLGATYDVGAGDWAVITRPLGAAPGTVDKASGAEVASRWDDIGPAPVA